MLTEDYNDTKNKHGVAELKEGEEEVRPDVDKVKPKVWFESSYSLD